MKDIKTEKVEEENFKVPKVRIRWWKTISHLRKGQAYVEEKVKLPQNFKCVIFKYWTETFSNARYDRT